MILAPENGRSGKYVPEHILVAEKMIGRGLLRGEVVHHIDGDKLNNSESNLLVCSRVRHRALHAEMERLAFSMVRSGAIRFTGRSYERVEF